MGSMALSQRSIAHDHNPSIDEGVDREATPASAIGGVQVSAPQRFVLNISSHALANFRRCETRYLYSDIYGLRSLTRNTQKMDKGTQCARWLQTYYVNKMRRRTSRDRYLIHPLWISRFISELKVSQADALTILQTLLAYAQHYRDETWVPIAAERGFSKVLFEDSENLFVYEGRPDLVVLESQAPNADLIVCDHKTQGQKKSYYEFTDQPESYIWAYGAKKFVYNYINFGSKSEPFRREAHIYTQAQIDDWQSNATERCFELKHCIEKRSFPARRNCEDKFGICEYHRICEQPKDSVKLHVIRSNFNQEKPRRSW